MSPQDGMPAEDDPRAARIEQATQAQRVASDPAVSVWTVANAGSGKTRVLTDRVARLLLEGAEPSRILCLTYTKAAAAEMVARLTRTLGGWVLRDDAALGAALTTLTGAPPSAAQIPEARRLFAKALETPGGLKIQTIHAFCDSVLRRFPLEAGVAPDFRVLDPPTAAALADEALETAARAEPRAFEAAAACAPDETIQSLAEEIQQRRALFDAPADHDAVAAAFGLSRAALDEAPMAGFWDGADRDALNRAAAILTAGKPKGHDQRVGRPLAAALAASDDDEALATALQAFCFKSDGDPRDFGKIPTGATDEAHPWLRPLLGDLAERATPMLQRAEAAAAARRAIALADFAQAYRQAFEAAKRALGALDFDDLIQRAAALLRDRDAGAWARYKLDGGVDHILVDEAQDTAPAQWAVIEALAGEIAAGAGARDTARTLFVVGDEKQSIYSFQGADLSEFEAARARLTGAFGDRLRSAPLTTSFRSAPAILRAVDETFAGDAGAGVLSGEDALRHVSAAEARVGRVDLWPLLPPAEKPAPGDWRAPVDSVAPGAPRLQVAQALAATLAQWLENGEPLPGGDRRLLPRDVLVLVRSRNELAGELVRGLKARGVAVAGADRLRLTQTLAVRDLLALARFAVTPQDDLSLAALLRSPLYAMPLPALETLCTGRVGAGEPGSLWRALRADPAHAGVAASLAQARREADLLRPFEFLMAALRRDDGRRRLVGRLGPEADDAIEALLGQAIAFESDAIPTLEGFLGWIARGDLDVKREMDKPGDDGPGAVRVMTVHGAKGLEAPLVILPDCGPRRGGRGAQIRALPAEGQRPAVAGWAGGGLKPQAMRAADEAAKAAAEDESRRLLYVAMTRAQRWLIVAGAGAEPDEAASATKTWHGLVADGLRRAGAQRAVTPDPAQAAGVGAEALRLADAEPRRAAPATRTVAPAPTPPPAWAEKPPPPAPSSPPRLAASALGGDEAFAPDPAPLADPAPALAVAGPIRAAMDPRLRGVALHALLEHLPDAPPADRPAVAARLCRAALGRADEEAVASLLAEADAVMAAPAIAAVFRPDALAEAALSVAIPGLGRITGRIDRLHVGPETVLAVDFKTDADPPAPGAAPEAYLRQLAVYRHALGALHPDRRVVIGLMWTSLARFDALDDASLTAALARAVTAGS